MLLLFSDRVSAILGTRLVILAKSFLQKCHKHHRIVNACTIVCVCIGVGCDLPQCHKIVNRRCVLSNSLDYPMAEIMHGLVTDNACMHACGVQNES